MSNGLIFRLGTRLRISSKIFLKGFLGGKPIAAKLAAFHLALPKEIADVALRVASEFRCLFDRDPIGQ